MDRLTITKNADGTQTLREGSLLHLTGSPEEVQKYLRDWRSQIVKEVRYHQNAVAAAWEELKEFDQAGVRLMEVTDEDRRAAADATSEILFPKD